MSFKQYTEVIGTSQLSSDKKQTEMIKRVGTKIQKSVETFLQQQNALDKIKGFQWEYNLIESKEVNAWCMPGGKVAFYTGIMPICKDELGVAVVMGHEVAHAVAHHGSERMSQQLLANYGIQLLSNKVGTDPSQKQAILMQAVGIGTELGIKSFSRSHESEADRMGLIFMAMAGYDPREAPRFWQRMAKASGNSQTPVFLSTHPSNAARIKDLNALMPQALQYYKK